MAISYVGVSASWSSTATSSSYTINKPAGTLADGDLMIAVLAWTTGATGSDLTCTVPSGWTKQDELFKADSFGVDGQLCVMTRSYVAGDPSSWSGTLSSSSAVAKISGVSAYRGVQSILVKGTSTSSSSSSYSTATVNNTVANSWRFTTAMAQGGSLTYSLNTNEVSSRAHYTAHNTTTDDTALLRIADSNGTISTGNTSRTISRSVLWSASCSWIAILKETPGVAATGTFAMTCGPVAVAGAGEVHDDAAMAMQLSGVTMAGSGFGSPPDITSDMAIQLGGISESFSGALPVSGVMSMAVLSTIDFQVETRVFGIRVITVEADDTRTILVSSRGVDD